MDVPDAHASNPFIVAVDLDPVTRSMLVRELTARYGDDYSVRVAPSFSDAADLLRELAASGHDVAVVLADYGLPDGSGRSLLASAHQLYPLARRGLLVALGQDPAAREAVVNTCSLGFADYYLVKPASVRDERFHRGLTEFLDEWWRSRGRPVAVISVVGEEPAARSHEICDLLQRHEIPYAFHAAASATGQAMLAASGVVGDSLPVVIFQDGRALVDPSNRDVAKGLGVAVEPADVTYDVAIIGGGPAGLAAAVYASSEGLNTVLLEREALGGQAGTSSMIRNYLGFPRGISGAELASRAVDQAVLFGTDIVYGCTASTLRADGDRRIVTLSDGGEVTARAVVIATGVAYRGLAAPGLDPLIGAGVFYGASASEAPAVAGDRVFVVGAGNSAGQAAVHLAKYAEHVTMLVRSDTLAESMSQYLITDIAATANIDVRHCVEVAAGGGNGRLERLELKDRRTGATDSVLAAALFVLIGAEPRTDWLPPTVLRDQWGYILTGARCGVATCDMATCGIDGQAAASSQSARAPLLLESSMPGVFAVGDVRQGSVKRVASAAGEGSICIRLVHDYLALLAEGR